MQAHLRAAMQYLQDGLKYNALAQLYWALGEANKTKHPARSQIMRAINHVRRIGTAS